jgi:DNA polymerase III subunit gamma/tau
MYQALYRKYRPTTLEEVVGQDSIIKVLGNQIKNNNISHAYLFTGPRGTGKTSVAKLFSKLVNCEKLLDLKPCNKCVSCTQINGNQSTDVIEIDAASNNGIEEIRELKSKINLTSSLGKYKIYIIDEVHMMTNQAFNALLKTLEEPPKHVIFILATTDPQKIPLTILSRCQRFDYKKISQKNIVDKILKIAEFEKIQISEEAANDIAKFSDGGMRDALSLLDKALSYTNELITRDVINEINGVVSSENVSLFIKQLRQGQIIENFDMIDDFDNNGKDIVNIFESIMFGMRDLLIEKVESVDDFYIKALKIANEYFTQMKSSSNPRLMMELYVVEMSNHTTSVKEALTKEEPKNSELPLKDDVAAVKDIEKKEEVLGLNLNIIKNEDNHNLKIDFERIKEIRINNALSALNKKEMINIIKKMENINEYAINNKYKKIIPVIIDGEIKAFGNNQLVFIFKEEFCEKEFNNNLDLIESLIYKISGNKYKAIALLETYWSEIKKEYNSKTKKYEYIEDNFNIQMFANKASKKDEGDDIFKTFGEIVNYK